jgi:hypothetical protein
MPTSSLTGVSFGNLLFAISFHSSSLSDVSDQTIYSFAVCGFSGSFGFSEIVGLAIKLFSVMVYARSLLPTKRYHSKYTPISLGDLIMLFVLSSLSS